jgi:hypothetical protein
MNINMLYGLVVVMTNNMDDELNKIVDTYYEGAPIIDTNDELNKIVDRGCPY